MGKKRFDGVMKSYEETIEELYERSVLYKTLVQLSRIARMFLYIVLGVSMVFVAMFEQTVITIDEIIVWLAGNPFGKAIVVFLGLLFIIYGFEKGRE